MKMTDNQRTIIEKLIEEGYKRLNSPPKFLNFGTQNKESEQLLNDIKNHPHFYVLGCVMDRQIKAEKAWIIPYTVSQVIKSTKILSFLNLTGDELINLFVTNKYHRFNKTMAECFIGLFVIYMNYITMMLPIFGMGILTALM